ncbi:MAG: DNA polymerase III subunit delta' [Gammaproteobacteria bacterium]
MSPPYTWQTEQWQRLWRLRSAQRMPHAVLIRGGYGMGISEFARVLAASLLCAVPNSEGAPCGQCKSCMLFSAGNHPEYCRITPEAKSTVIKIDQVRALPEFVGMRNLFGPFKVVVIDPADAMNRNSANSLLKVLEEPPPQSVILLVTERSRRLPATITSRCQRVDFFASSKAQGRDWLRKRVPDEDVELLLEMADNGPLKALELWEAGAHKNRAAILEGFQALVSGLADPVAVAQDWSRGDSVLISGCLFKLFADLATLKFARGASIIGGSAGKETQLRAISEQLGTRDLFAAYDRLLRCKELLNSERNISAHNVFEELTINWCGLLHP